MARFLLFSLLLLYSLSGATQANAKLEAEIRHLEQRIVTAILNADTNALKQLWAPEFLVNNPRGRVASSPDSVIVL
ncbi:MAG TPA: nuclear transport factor 2 family protein [Flavisolibacter sp.]|nr:nuclear transport factor 2 family protein [Flavisolibacter sp.]